MSNEKALFNAIEKGYKKRVKFLLQTGTSIHVEDANGNGVLHYALLAGYEMVRFLIEKGADPKKTNQLQESPLHLAITRNYSNEIVDILLNTSFPPEKREGLSPRGFSSTAHEFAYEDKCERLESLPDSILTDVDEAGYTPLHYAAARGNKKTVIYLLNRGAKVDKKSNSERTAFLLAARNGHLNLIVYFLNNYPINLNDQDKKSWTALTIAATYQHESIVELLIDQGASLFIADKNKLLPLHWAVREKNNKNVVKILLQAGLNATKNNTSNGTKNHEASFTALKSAVQMGHVDIIAAFAQFMSHLFKIKDKKGQTVLHWAVQSENHDSIQYLCSMPEVEKNPCDNEEKTPLYYAVTQQKLALIDLLLALGVPNQVKSLIEGKRVDIAQLAAFLGYKKILFYALIIPETNTNLYATPLYMAAEGKKLQFVKFLLQKGTDVNATNVFGWTALHVASERGYLEIVDLLLQQKNIKIDATNKGWTALHLAASNGHTEVVELLLQKNANSDIKTNAGDTPLSIAINNGHWKLISIFKTKQPLKLTNKDIIELDEHFIPFIFPKNSTPRSDFTFLTHLELSNHHFDDKSADAFVSIFKKASPKLTSVNLSNNPKMGNGQLLPVLYSGVQKIFSELDQITSITEFDLSISNLNQFDIDILENALAKNLNLKHVLLWENSLEVLTSIFNSNVNKVQGKRAGALMHMRPILKIAETRMNSEASDEQPHHEIRFPNIRHVFGNQLPYSSIGDGNDNFKDIFSYFDSVSLKLAALVNRTWYEMAHLPIIHQIVKKTIFRTKEELAHELLRKGYFTALIDPMMGLQDWLLKEIDLSTFRTKFIYYVAYWHDRHETISIYLKYLETFLSKNKRLHVVFWEGFYNGLSENQITGKKLILSNCFLDNDQLKNGLNRLFLPQIPCQELERFQNLAHLDLSNNQISHWGIGELLTWLKNTTKLTYLDLSGNPLSDPIPVPAGVVRLSEALPSFQNLKTLILSKCSLWSLHIELLSEKIQIHPTLTYVNLNKNNIDNNSATVLATMLLKSGPHFAALHLENNNIEDAGAMKLLEVLNQKTHLTDLTLTTETKISENTMGPIRWHLAKNQAKTPTQPPSGLKQKTIQETQSRLLQWQTVCYAWDRYAEAMDKKHSSPEKQDVLFSYYQTMANRLIAQLSPSACNVIWGEKIPDKPIPNTYYLIRKNEKANWQLFYIENTPTHTYCEIPCEEISGLKELLTPLLTEPIEKIIASPPSEIHHIINQYHTKNLPTSSENLSIFYHHLFQGLEKLFMAFFCVGSKIIDTNVTKPIGYLGKGIHAIGDTLSGIEFSSKGIDLSLHLVGKAFNLVGWVLTVADKLQQGNDLHQFSKIGRIHTFNALTQQLALHLTLSYQHQIFALSPQSSTSKSEPSIEKSPFTHRIKQPPLEEFADFIVAKIGIRCIAGEAAENTWKFTDAVSRLSELAMTPHTSLFEEKKEKIVELLFSCYYKVATENTDIYLKKHSWELHELCSQTAVFDYVTGDYYTSPLAQRKTQIEKFGYTYGRQKTNTQHLQPAAFSKSLKDINLFPSMPALLQKFLNGEVSQSGLALTTAYDIEIIHYFMTQLENHTQCICNVFTSPANSENPLEKFKNNVQQLVRASHQRKRPAVFISQIPQKEDHFIGGFIDQEAVLLLNPFGEKSEFPDAFNDTLLALQQNPTNIGWLGLIKTRLCKSTYDKITTTSTAPIILELVSHFLKTYMHQGFVDIWTNIKATAGNTGSVDLSPLLKSSSLLLQLHKDKSQISYQQTMIELRQSHYEQLQQWVFEENHHKVQRKNPIIPSVFHQGGRDNSSAPSNQGATSKQSFPNLINQ